MPVLCCYCKKELGPGEGHVGVCSGCQSQSSNKSQGIVGEWNCSSCGGHGHITGPSGATQKQLQNLGQKEHDKRSFWCHGNIVDVRGK